MHCTKLAAKVGALLKEKSLKITTAESCTGGLLSARITDIPGSSAWFDRAFITYSNEAKQEMLSVRKSDLKQYGAVSEPIVMQMAREALINSQADLCVSISGIAGPDGGTADKPVGLVWFGFAEKDKPIITQQKIFSGDRLAVREQAVEFALTTLLNIIHKPA